LFRQSYLNSGAQNFAQAGEADLIMLRTVFVAQKTPEILQVKL
jgi:hypothetical protein